MAAIAIGSGLAFVLVALGVPVPAAAPARPLAELPFDLAAATLARPPAERAAPPPERLAVPRHDPATLTGPGWTPPSKAWGDPARGPVLQVGALGARDKRVPDLAHIALDWDF